MSSASKINVWEDSRLRGYLGAVNRRCGVVETLALPTMRDLPPVKIETLFVPPLLSTEAVDANIDSDEWPEGKSLLEALQEYPRLIVLGDPGGGKTTLSNWIAWRLTSGLTSPLPARLKNIIPLTCVLREMPSDSFKEDMSIFGLASFIAKKLLGEERSEDVIPVLNEWISSGRFILILDGIDEIPLHSRVTVARWIREARDRDACVLATSRIVGYNDYPVDSPVKEANASKEIPEPFFKHIISIFNDAKKVLEADKSTGAWAEIRYLMPFDKSQISDFARNWYRQRCTSDGEAKSRTLDLLGALNDSEITSKLARTPNLLSLMAVVHRERAHLPDGKALLYEEIVNAYLNTIDTQRKIVQDDVLGSQAWRDKKSWLSYVGYMMQSTRQSYSEEGILVSERKVISWLVKAMKQSKVSNPEAMAVEFLAWVARRSGLLLPRGEGLYAFVHLSFQEYFCACYIESSVVLPNFFNLEVNPKLLVKPSQLREWANRASWLETLIFVFEILSNERNDSWVKSLVGVIYPEYPRYAPVDGPQATLAARILTNKHVKLDRGWINYLADISCVRLQEVARDSAHNSAIASFASLGLALVIDNSDEDNIQEGTGDLSKYDNVDLSSVRVLVVRSVAELTSNFLRRFERLFVLDCEDCGLIDISECSSKYLSTLSVNNSRLKGCEKIGDFKRLRSVTLMRVSQEGLEYSSGSSNVEAFTAYRVNIGSIQFIKDWKKLIHLDLTDLDVEDVSVIGAFKKILYLTIEGCPVRNVDFLGSLKDLEYLSIGGCPIESIPTLKSRSPITVMLMRLKIDSLACLSELSQFRGGMISDCPVTSLGELHAPNVSFLSLSKLPLKNLNGVERLQSLRSLQIQGINVSDFSPLSSLKNLLMLRISKVPVNDFNWARSLTKIATFAFTETNVKDIEPLLKMKSLREVVVSETDEVDLSRLESNPKIMLTVHPDSRMI